MKILVNIDGHVDLEAPIQMTDEQREKFIEFFKKMFSGVETGKVREKTKSMGERDIAPKKWTIDELHLLVGPDNNQILAEKMGRTTMSVGMERGHFVPEFMTWAKSKGYTFPVKKEMVREFMEERSG